MEINSHIVPVDYFYPFVIDESFNSELLNLAVKFSANHFVKSNRLAKVQFYPSVIVIFGELLVSMQVSVDYMLSFVSFSFA